MTTQTYTIAGMDCPSCARSIEDGLCRLPNVASAQVDYANQRLSVTGNASAAQIEARIKALGYRVADEQAAQSGQVGGVRGFGLYLLRERATQMALLGASLIAVTLILGWLGVTAGVLDAVLVLALALAAWPIASNGVRTLLINHTFNINLLMTIAAVGALIIGETTEAVTVVVLFAIGEALEGYTTDRARASIRGLLDLAPPQALRLIAGREETVPVEQIVVGDMLLVRAGDRVPLDGVVRTGSSAVDQAPITGESVPVSKAVGDDVWAGTINGAGVLQIEVTRPSSDSTLSRIIRMVETAQGSRANTQRIIDRFARWYTPAVVVLAILVATIPTLLGAPFWDTPGTHGWLYRALALLVIACPCALVISAPVTVISGITAAARRGVLIKGGLHLETLGRVRAIAFDKTGTLTRGEPITTAVRALDCPTGEACDLCDDVLALASAVERHSTHPLARAITQAATERRLVDVYAPAAAITTLNGRGVQGVINGKTVTVGSHALFDAEHPHAQPVCDMVARTEAQGQTAMLLCDGDRVRGLLAVADAVRPESRGVIDALHAAGLHTTMLTGDNAIVADAIGTATNVRTVQASMLPEHKLTAIQELQAQYGAVAMVGDGINDTPALAQADVGIAMGGAGSAHASETADVVLMADSLAQLPFAIRVARTVRRLIGQNIGISLATKAVFMVLAIAGLSSLWMAILADVGVTLLVTLNGMRPLRLTPDQQSGS